MDFGPISVYSRTEREREREREREKKKRSEIAFWSKIMSSRKCGNIFYHMRRYSQLLRILFLINMKSVLGIVENTNITFFEVSIYTYLILKIESATKRNRNK